MRSLKTLFENINAVVPDPKSFFWITASVVDTAVVNPKGIKTYLANCLSTFPFKS